MNTKDMDAIEEKAFHAMSETFIEWTTIHAKTLDIPKKAIMIAISRASIMFGLIILSEIDVVDEKDIDRIMDRVINEIGELIEKGE